MTIWQELRENREAGARRLVAEYGDRLYAAALFICPSPADAEGLCRSAGQADKRD